MSSHGQVIREALARLVAQDRFEKPYADAAWNALDALEADNARLAVELAEQEGYPGIAHDFNECQRERDRLREALRLIDDRWTKGLDYEPLVARTALSGVITNEPDEDDLLAGLPPDLARVLRDHSVIVPQDSRVFELIAEWANAKSNTASAGEEGK